MRLNERNAEQALVGLADALAASGLTKLLLHAWERRYGIVPAERTESGRRLYTSDQVERLRLLKACCDGGGRIGALVAHSDGELVRIEQAMRVKLGLTEILSAVEALDGDRLNALLQARVEAGSHEDFLRNTALPLMREVGQRWANGSLTIAAEHMTTAQIKRILGGMFDRCPPAAANAPRMIATTPERQHHDIGALVVTLLARLRGWNALFLGASLPAGEIVEAAHRRGVDYVCLSALTGRTSTLERQLRSLRTELAPGIGLWIGGYAYGRVQPLAGVTFLPNFDAFTEALSASPQGFSLAV